MKDNLSFKDKILLETLTKKFSYVLGDLQDLMDQIENEDTNAECDSKKEVSHV